MHVRFNGALHYEIEDNVLAVRSSKRKVATINLDPATLVVSAAPLNKLLMKEAIAYYQTGSRAFKQNALKSPDYGGAKR